MAKGRLYASVLVVPRRKAALVEALHGRAAMTGVRAPWPTMGSSHERERRGVGAWNAGSEEEGGAMGRRGAGGTGSLA
jgi:hypothetical protein